MIYMLNGGSSANKRTNHPNPPSKNIAYQHKDEQMISTDVKNLA